MEYVRAFLLGGLLCALGQILIDRTALASAKILTGYVTAWVLLSTFGVYQPLADWGGATVPLTGFGHLLAQGVRKAVEQQGLLGALTGGITAVIFFGSVVATILLRVNRRDECGAMQRSPPKASPERGGASEGGGEVHPT